MKRVGILIFVLVVATLLACGQSDDAPPTAPFATERPTVRSPSEEVYTDLLSDIAHSLSEQLGFGKDLFTLASEAPLLMLEDEWTDAITTVVNNMDDICDEMVSMANPKAFDEVQREMTLACDDFGRANSKIRLFAADPAFDDYHIGLISDATAHLTDGRGHMETGTALLLELQ